MERDTYKKFAYKLLDGIRNTKLLTADNRRKITDMIEAEALELWEINEEILSLILLRPELIAASKKYGASTAVRKPFKEHGYKESGTDYTWMYQLKNSPPRLDDFNDYFVRAIGDKNSDYYCFFLHYYEPILNKRVQRYLEFYYLPGNLLQDLKQTFALTLWEQMLAYDVSNDLPLLQVAEPIYKRAWHKYVARNVGAVTMPEKVYAVFRKVAAIFHKCMDEGMSAAEAETKVYEAFPSEDKRTIKRALQMLPSWREAMPILNKSEPDGNGYGRFCAYEESIADQGNEPFDVTLCREELFDAFRKASKALSYKEKQIFEKINGVRLDTMETFKPIDRQTIALDHGYSDESGVRKTELDIYNHLAAELYEIGLIYSVFIKKIKPPKDASKAKNLIYYEYFPNCDKDGGIIVINTCEEEEAEPFEVMRIAEDDTMNSLKYAHLAVKELSKISTEELPSTLLIARFKYSPRELTPMQWVALWSRISSLHTASKTPDTAT